MSRIGRASVIGVLSQLLTVAISLWATPKLLHGLTEAVYGVLAIVVSFSAYFAYLELGIGGAYIRALSMSLARGEHDRSQALTQTAQFLYLIVAAVGALGMLAIGWPYLGKAVLDPALLGEARFGLVAVALTFAITMSLSAPRVVVIASQRLDLYTLISLVVQPLIPIIQVLVLVRHGRLVAVLCVQAIGTVLVDLILASFARRLQPQLHYRPHFVPEIWRELRDFSQKKFVSQLAQQGQWTGDRLLVGAALSSEAVALYAVPASIAQRLRTLTNAVLAPAFPAFAEAYGGGGGAALSPALRFYGRRVGVLMALGIAGGAFVARAFLLAWVGPRFADSGTIILQTQLIATGLLVVSGLFGSALEAAGRPEKAMHAGVAGLLVSIGASVALVRMYGGAGVSYGFALGAATQCGWTCAQLPALHTDARAVIADCLAKPALVCVVAYLAARSLSLAWAAVAPASLAATSHSLPVAIALACGGALFGLGAAFPLGLFRRAAHA